MDRLTRLILGIAAVIVVGTCCAHVARRKPLVPMVERPQTNEIAMFIRDSSIIPTVRKQAAMAAPNEYGACIYGRLSGDSLFADYLVTAETDSASPTRLWTTGAGCDDNQRLIGFLHTHDIPRNARCEHSPADAIRLSLFSEFLVSIVVCSNGLGEGLLQDGRRWGFRWGWLRAPQR